MAFFTLSQKKLARKQSVEQLNRNYKLTELKLKQAAEKGSERELKKIMKEHQKFEYALLYKQTPKEKNRGEQKLCK